MKILIDMFWKKYAELKTAIGQNDSDRITVLDRDLDPLLDAIIRRSADNPAAIHAQFRFALDLLSEEADDCSCVQRNIDLLKTLVDRYVADGGARSDMADDLDAAHEETDILDENLLDSISDCVTVITPSYRISYMNDANARRQGIRRDEALGRHIAELIGLHHFQHGFRDRLDLCLQGKSANYTYADEVDGRTIVFSCDMSPCYSSRNRLAGVMVVTQEREDRRKRNSAA